MATNSPEANSQSSASTNEPRGDTSFAETALKLGGKSADEARRTGAIDQADDNVEALFKPQYQTVNSPVHRAVWDGAVSTDEFLPSTDSPTRELRQVMDESINVVQRHRAAGTLMNHDHKISDRVMGELGDVGYWGLLVDKQYGGSAAPFSHFAPFLTRMAMADPTIAGLASVHGCIGAVDPVRTFGNESQKKKYLPKLASGEKLSAFALTEPCAGSDLTALRTRAVLEGDQYVVNGEKLFITNVVPGRTIGLVCLIDDMPAVLVCDLPETENEQFQLKKYGLWALKHTYNRGIIFNNFRVPMENLLEPMRGNGLTIAYHGLNLGRISLCANAAGTMRLMMASMIPWAKFRVTYGEAIAERELVQRRLGRLAGLIVGCDALVSWCSALIDQGYRGEMECIVAKIFGSEAQKEAAIEFFMKTHGGRSFLHGHNFGDNVHEYLAPCIYEGEGEMLGLAFFKSLIKHHGTTFFEPIGKALAAAGIKNPSPFNPSHAWALKGALLPYAKWYIAQQMRMNAKPELPDMPDRLRNHAQYAVDRLTNSSLEISGTMRKHQLKLADRQCRMADTSARIQSLVVILCASLYASRETDEVVQDAADILCQDLRRQLDGRRPSDKYLRAVTKLGETISNGGFKSVAGLEPEDILMSYD